MTDSRATRIELENGTRFLPSFDRDGLLPAIVTDGTQGGVLMFAFMNAQALQATLRTGYATFYSRSRARLWVKGEESGNKLRVIEIRTDCDQDVLWISAHVEGAGAACHTGARSCFYRLIETDGAGGVALRRDAD
jgi:phosphoribosyl-AMP cyclohydrolase